ncbi:MAG: Uma2 family endonuclease [Microcoleaceae cyanobacterium]
MLLNLQQLTVPPGSHFLLHNISWQDFEQILEDLGEHRSARIAYEHGILEIMVPLSEHEIGKVIIGDLVKALLEELEIDFWSLGSTTFKSPEMFKGIEPDDCFYIEQEAKIRSQDRIDLTVDPPPDLAIEIDVTSRTHSSIYETLNVSELWRFEKGKLQINVLQAGKYVEVEYSPHFPGFPLKSMIPEYLQRCKTDGRNKTMKAFRSWIRSIQ